MGKEGELWDDSALIKAFDDAVSKYKKMHSKESKDEGIIADENHEAIRDADDNNSVASDTAIELGETKSPTQVEENHSSASVEPAPCMDSSIGQYTQAVNNYSYSPNGQDYNQLLGQYYDLEEKRQRILHQLQQLGGYDYQFPPAEGFGSSQHFGSCCNPQDCSVPTSQPSISNFFCPYCHCACNCSMALCTSFPSCSFVGTCSGKPCPDSSTVTVPKKYAPLIDGEIVKTAMGAAEQAISSMKAMQSLSSGTEGKEKVKGNEEEMSQTTSAETDLSVVLNAWYSAGFYTGKYLTEQSIMKK